MSIKIIASTTYPFLGFDHVDVRVRRLPDVEAFYDRLMPELGLPAKSYAFVDERGEWSQPDADHAYNTVEYHAPAVGGEAECFIGFIQDSAMRPTATRIAFAVASKADVVRWADRLVHIGALAVELSSDFDAYPAVFFEDPGGTRLELCARRPT